MSIAAVMLMGLLATPLSVADDYSFLCHTNNLFVECEGTLAAIEEDGSDSHGICSCRLCMETLGESLAPGVTPPKTWGWFTQASLKPISALYRPEIFRPPTS
jgi:hypothetical protein